MSHQRALKKSLLPFGMTWADAIRKKLTKLVVVVTPKKKKRKGR